MDLFNTAPRDLTQILEYRHLVKCVSLLHQGLSFQHDFIVFIEIAENHGHVQPTTSEPLLFVCWWLTGSLLYSNWLGFRPPIAFTPGPVGNQQAAGWTSQDPGSSFLNYFGAIFTSMWNIFTTLSTKMQSDHRNSSCVKAHFHLTEYNKQIHKVTCSLHQMTLSIWIHTQSKYLLFKIQYSLYFYMIFIIC